MEVGLRVVRGPDWQWQDQDGGEGHVGTVVEIGGRSNNQSPEKTVVVQWDNGMRTNYRCGYQNSYDLRVFDNAPCGVKHPDVSCRFCQRKTIKGFLFKCTKCADVSLCNVCYFGEKHDLNHSFYRIDTPASRSVKLPKRSESERIDVKGIFVGANVVRGHDWNWHDQDGGQSKTGRVQEIRGWEQESFRSVACVHWFTTRITNVYRVGHKGKVDLKCIAYGETNGGSYYRDHLPVLGMSTELVASISGANALGVTPRFRIGDPVRVAVLDVETLKRMQAEHGGWNAKMSEYVAKHGRVHRITEKGDIRVQYERNVRWTFNPEVLLRLGERETDQPLPAGGNASPATAAVALSSGQPTSSASMSDAPSSGFVDQEEEEEDVAAGDDAKQDPQLPSTAPGVLSSAQSGPAGQLDRLVTEAAQGNFEKVEQLVTRYPECVNQRFSGKTALQVAAHLGRLDIVLLLFLNGAQLDLEDDEGDTALHYAAFGNQPQVIETLIEKGASANKQNRDKQCTPLHIAINKQFADCVAALLRFDATDVNMQDAYGDTPLHDAINKSIASASASASASAAPPPPPAAPAAGAGDASSPPVSPGASATMSPAHTIVDALVRHARTNPFIRNKRGFNCVHQAALKGNLAAMRRLAERWPAALEMPKDDGFTALHIAALNGHLDIVRFLLDASVTVDVRTNKLQTALMLAVAQNYAAIAALLLERGADVNAVDDNGDSCLLMSLMTFLNANAAAAAAAQRGVTLELEASGIGETYAHLERLLVKPRADIPAQLVLVTFLIRNGAQWTMRNQRGETVFDYVKRVRAEVNHQFHAQSNAAAGGQPSAPQPAGQVPMSAAQLERTLKELSTIDMALQRITQKVYLQELLPSDAFCTLCQDELAEVVFMPCRHRLVCLECCRRIKKCMRCQGVVEQKLVNNQDVATLAASEAASKTGTLPANTAAGAIPASASAQSRSLAALNAYGPNMNPAGGHMSLPPGATANALNSFNAASQPVSTMLADPSVAMALESENSELRRQLQDARHQAELKILCSICMENEKTVAFSCGHTYCTKCAEQLTKTCPTCRKPITKRFNVFI